MSLTDQTGGQPEETKSDIADAVLKAAEEVAVDSIVVAGAQGGALNHKHEQNYGSYIEPDHVGNNGIMRDQYNQYLTPAEVQARKAVCKGHQFTVMDNENGEPERFNCRAMRRAKGNPDITR